MLSYLIITLHHLHQILHHLPAKCGAVQSLCRGAESGNESACGHVGRAPDHGGGPQYPLRPQLSWSKAEKYGGCRGSVAYSGGLSGVQKVGNTPITDIKHSPLGLSILPIPYKWFLDFFT